MTGNNAHLRIPAITFRDRRGYRRHVDLRQLEFFVAVAEERHFGRAAERLFVGQPAISQGISRLERRLHLDLFDRSGRQVRLTAAGEQFLTHARAVLAAASAATAAATELADNTGAMLKIGTCDGLGDHIHRVLSAFAAARPDVEVRLASTSARERHDRVAGGGLDLAFTHDTEDRSDVEAVPVWRDPLMVALPAGHPLADKKELALTDLADLPLRIVQRPKNPSLRNLVLGACRDAGFEPRLTRTAGNLEHNLAEIGTGAPSWTVIYASHARRINTSTEAFRPLLANCLELPTYLLVRRTDKRVPIVRAFLRACTTPVA
jgi:DNA-binding transcriptional LysR family regulator